MTKKYIIKGLVQGIGYRPFVARIAEEFHITGWVRNTGGIVTVQASGNKDSLERFYNRLSKEVPTGGFISSIYAVDMSIPEDGLTDFKIIESDTDETGELPLIPTDIATCEECKKELFDKNNRRYLHPFISCTVCGPRYSIIEKLPYDRDTITMADFDMCPACKREYTGKFDRRRHAQTIACKDCGPKLEFIRLKCKNTENITYSDNVDNYVENYNENDLGAEISASVKLITQGGILAVKDIGGYHLVCNPFDEKAIAALRNLKHRERKAFAVMFEDVEQLKEYCYVNDDEAKLLESPARPIVLVKRLRVEECNDKKPNARNLAENVYLSSPDIGAMLPCNPVQMLLIRQCGPLIMTSGNASGDVLEIDNAQMKAWLQDRLDSGELGYTPVGLLSHDRRILRPMDDSVMKVVRGRKQFIRRGRGHVPNPISVDISEEIFAAGGDLKSSFCYVKNNLAYVSQYLGDLETVSCQRFYKKEMEAMQQIFGFEPKKVVTDMHPGYISKQIGDVIAEKENLPIKNVQHHKAHIMSVVAEHNLRGSVLGFSFDGTGYGEDGNIWGSEVFLWDGKKKIKRVSHLKPSKLIGGNEGAKNCDTILTGMLHSSGKASVDKSPDAALITAAIDNNINTITSTSMGRLFDAVSAMLDICHYNSYEGQAPVELENTASKGQDNCCHFHIKEDGDYSDIFSDIRKALETKVPIDNIARGFILAVSDFIIQTSKRFRRENNINQIVLSGGTFLNRILLENTIDGLEKEGFKVYISEQLPPGDGGICLGQAYILAHDIFE